MSEGFVTTVGHTLSHPHSTGAASDTASDSGVNSTIFQQCFIEQEIVPVQIAEVKGSLDIFADPKPKDGSEHDFAMHLIGSMPVDPGTECDRRIVRVVWSFAI